MPEYKRVLPVMGTFLEITLSGVEKAADSAGPGNDAVRNALDEVHRLEGIFSIFSQTSELTKLNLAPAGEKVPVVKELFLLLQVALRIWRESDGAFNPFYPDHFKRSRIPCEFLEEDGDFFIRKMSRFRLDLNGIAKGYVVDRAAHLLRTHAAGLAGVVNAGGDIRFFNQSRRSVDVRLGRPETPLSRRLEIAADCIATSSPGLSLYDERSSSHYSLQLRDGLSAHHSVSVIGPCCCLADSLTKVGLYGDTESIIRCAKNFQTQILIFDEAGSLTESFGPWMEAV